MPKFNLVANGSSVLVHPPVVETFTVYFEGVFDGASVAFEVQGDPSGEWHSAYVATERDVQNIEFKAYAYRVTVTGAGASTDVEVYVL